MKKLLVRLFRNRVVWFGFVAVVALLFIWVMAPIFWGDDIFDSRMQIFSTVVLLMFLALIVMYENLRAARDAGAIEQAMKFQAEEQLLGVRPDRKEEIEELQEKFTAALNKLKDSKLGGKGKSALYTLPWYMVIGPPASGKTVAIQNSELNFPDGSREEIRGIGGTRNCDWHFSSEAILLDTAGRWTMEEEDKEEWLSFLEMMKKFRKKQPINGVIVGISVTDLIGAMPEEIDRHARKIRKRIDELMEKFGKRFPIYLVFTKCDLLQGFVEFFEDFSLEEQRQAWGYSLSKDEREAGDISAIFKREFRNLASRLDAMKLNRLNHRLQGKTRHKVYIFPMEFNGIQKPLHQFVSRLFQDNTFEENPLLRGFYFTSATQEGLPIDRVVQQIANMVDLPAVHLSSANEAEPRSFFVRDLFKKIIIPDRDMVRYTKQGKKQQQWFELGSLAGIGLALLWFLWGSYGGYEKTGEDALALNQIKTEMQSIQWASKSNIVADMNNLDRLYQQMDSIDGPLTSWGIYRADDVKDEAEQVYYEKLDVFAQRYIYDDIARKLSTYNRSRDARKRQAYTEYLQAYLLLGDSLQKVSEDHEEAFLKDNLLAWSQELIPKQAQNEAFSDKFQRHINYYIDETIEKLKDKIPVVEQNSSFVAQARQQLRVPPSIETLYQNQLIAKISNEVRPYNLNRIFKEANADSTYIDFFTENPSVRGAYTKNAVEKVAERIKELGKKPEASNWVLGVTEKLGLKEKEIKERLTDKYNQDYTKSWQNFLKKIKFKPFSNLQEATERFDVLGNDTRSPLVVILDAAYRQTNLEPLKSKILNYLPDWKFLQDGNRHPVDERFEALHKFVNGEDGGKFGAVLSKFATVKGSLKQLTEADVPQEETTNYAEGVLLGEAVEIRDAFQEARNNVLFDLTVREQLFEKPLLYAWENILATTKGYLSRRWQEDVFTPFNEKLANLYPFNPNSTQDASLGDIATFFRSGGTLETFFEEELSRFMRNTRRLQFRSWQNRGIGLSNQTKRMLEKAETIRKGLGLDENQEVSVEFDVTPQVPNPQHPEMTHIILTIDGQVLNYEFGGLHPMTFTWPGPGTRQAWIEVRANNSSDANLFGTKEGPWGLFRLLENARYQRSTPTDYTWNFRWKNALTVSFKVKARKAENPFRSNDFFVIRCPRKL